MLYTAPLWDLDSLSLASTISAPSSQLPAQDVATCSSPSSSSSTFHSHHDATMADPLSVAASIAGLLSAGAAIAKALGPYVSAARETPQVAFHVHSEVQAATIILSALRSLAQNMASVSRKRAAMIELEQVIVVLTDGVFIFSDLEAAIKTLPVPASSSVTRMALRSRVQWAWKEIPLNSLLSRLQSFKSSISLILGILQRQDAPIPLPMITTTF